MMFSLHFISFLLIKIVLDTGCTLNAYMTFRRHPGRFQNILCTFNVPTVSRPGHLLNILCMFNLRPAYRGIA